MHPNQIPDWKAGLHEGAADVFGSEAVRQEPAVDVKTLHAKIGDLDAGEGALSKGGILNAKR